LVKDEIYLEDSFKLLPSFFYLFQFYTEKTEGDLFKRLESLFFALIICG
jgi:hypothetical protein